MKKLLVLAALSMAATPAMASKARMTALGNAAHLIDTQTVFVNVADIHYLGDYATVEFGSSANNAGGAAPRAEGGFVRSSSMGKWGAYLGRQSATVNEFVAAANAGLPTAVLMTEQNTLDLFYGTELAGQKWAFGLHHSAAKEESQATTLGNREVSTLGLSLGVRNDIWNAFARIGLGGETKSDFAGAGTPELKQKGLIDVGGGYWFDTVYASVHYITTKGTLTAGGNDVDAEKNAYSVSVIDNVKVDGGNFFYGVSYSSNELKNGSDKTTTTGLPVLVGMEMDATAWLVLRGSISQNVLLGEVKTEAGGSTTDKMANNTTVAAGAGLKFNKLTLDATLAGSTTGDINGNTLFANSALTYNF